MDESKKVIARAAVEAALILFAEDSESSSSDSDDDVEMLVMKMYLKYKAKRRKYRPRPRPRPRPIPLSNLTDSDCKQRGSNDHTNNEDNSGDQLITRPRPRPSPIKEGNQIKVQSADEQISDVDKECNEDNNTFEPSISLPVASSSFKRNPVKLPLELHVSKLSSFIPNSLALQILTDQDFRSLFKLSRSSVESLVRAIKSNQAHRRSGRPMMAPERSILIFLWFLGTRESYTSVSQRFNIRKSVAYAAFAHTCQSVSALKEQHIQWPTGEAAQRVIRGFEADTSAQFPGVIGCLGATHIPISEPKDTTFLNRAEYNSVILQAVCDATGAFIDVFTGWPGSASHSHVWLYSPLYGELQVNPDFLPDDMYLLGSEVYPLSQDLMVPFQSTSTLTPSETHFNKALHAKRAILQRAFAQLKHRFERLNFLHVRVVENIKYITLAACVCHNIATREADESDSQDVVGDEGLDVPQMDDEEIPVGEEALEKRSCLADKMFVALA